ncbi:MAG: PSD1 and planctomycete cytochrome C domain-containing protein [Verrucomicrobiales bacterium]|nr:PSD1 and planctomycete cytochrome C domain-containing protein [Verrucomicrobiales bacterium]
MRRIFIFLAGLLIPVAAPANPEPRKMPAAVQRSVDFAEDIKPILERSCVNCHANGKRKGGFSIDHLHSFIAGGDSGPAVRQGKSAESLLIELVLSNDPDELMPSKGKRLSLDEVALLRAWIDQGLKWEKGFTFAKFRNAPVAPRKVVLPDGPEANPVDRLLAPYYSKHKIDPAVTVPDRIFVRRVFLDTIGLLPSPGEVAAFREDKRPDKHMHLVEELLQDKKNYAEHWITFWSDCFRNSYTRQYHGGGGKRITDWLKKSLEENKPYDQFVRELINPVGGSDGFIKGVAWRGTVNASQVVEMQAAQNVAQVFLGLNIKCASCHDSFINDWTLKQTYSLASIFSDGPMDVHRCNKPTGDKAQPAFLYPELGTIDAGSPRKERVKQLSEIITSPKNGRLARTAVNRLWAIFFGRGLVDPVDEMDNPTWNQDLLDWLAVDFVDHGYDLKRTMSLLLTSRAYQRPSVRLDEDAEEFVFQGPVVRRMSAEQFLDGIDQVIVAAGKDAPTRHTGGKRAGMRNLDRLMRTLGRPKRDVVVTRRESTATTAQLIELSNGKPFANIMVKGGKAWKGSGHAADAIVGELFANAIGRSPSEKEMQSAQSVLGSPVNAQGVEDLLWMLAMHPEFQLIH